MQKTKTKNPCKIWWSHTGSKFEFPGLAVGGYLDFITKPVALVVITWMRS